MRKRYSEGSMTDKLSRLHQYRLYKIKQQLLQRMFMHRR